MEQEPGVADLVAAAAGGDAGAWDAIVERYTPLVLGVVRRHRLAPDDAQDVVQTVWLRLVEHLGGLREPRALPGWISATARHECLRLLGSARRARPVDDQVLGELPADDGRGVDAALLVAERHEALLAAFAELPDRQRALLLLLLEDPPLPYAEVSRRAGLPVGSIGPTRARALQRLRQSPALAALLAADEPEVSTP